MDGAPRPPRSIPPELADESDALSDLLLELASAPDRDPAALAPPLEAGATVGRFELLREVGRGGFGVVFEARDTALGRLVAFKAMRPSRAGGDLEKPLREEAEAAARLNHPNVVTLHDYGLHQGTPYLILELLRGETLQRRLKAGPLPTDEAMRIAVDVARGLVHAHAEGVLHRDLKPGNVFLTEGGGVKLLDFGLARLLDRASLAGGTPAYMAPEQLRGEPGDAPADVFAAAVVLFQSLAGRLPFPVVNGRSAVLDPGPPPPLPLDDPPPELAALLAGALSRDPAGRPQRAQAWLDGLLAVQRAYAERAAALARAERRHRARRALYAAGALALVGAAVATAFALRASARAQAALRASRIASAAEGASDPLLAALLMAELPDDAPPPRAIEIAQRLLSEAIPMAVVGPAKGGLGLAVSPDGSRVAAGTQDGVAVFATDGTGAPLLLRSDGGRTNAVAFTPDGTRVVAAGHDGEVHLFRADGTGSPVTLHGRGAPLVQVAVDAGGRLAAAGSLDGRLWLLDLAGSRPPRAVLHDGAVTALAFSPEGTRVATGAGDGFLRVIDAATCAVPVRAPLPGGAIYAVAWAPDGRALAVASEDGVARLLGPDGRVRESFGAPGPPLTSVAFDPAGARLVAGSQDGTARIWRLDAPAAELRLRGHRGAVIRARFMPDGKVVVTAGADGTIRAWGAEGDAQPLVLRGGAEYDEVLSPDGTRGFSRNKAGQLRIWRALDPRERGVLRHEALVDTVRWTRDGRRLLTASHDGTARLWPVHADGAPLVIKDPGRVLHSADLDPAERRIVTASEDGVVRIWDAATGALLRELRGHEGPVLSAAYSPDGAFIASGSLDSTVRIWRADGEGEPRVLRGQEGALTAVTWTPDGRAVIASSQLHANVAIWPRDGGEPRVIHADRAVFRASAMRLRDGRMVALVPEEDGPLRLFPLDGGPELPPFPALPEGLFTAAPSPDGRRIALTSTDGTVRIYPADGRGEPLLLRGAEGNVGHAAFSPDGTELAIAAQDGTARVFTVDWARLRAQLRAATSACLSVTHRVQVLGEAPEEAERRWETCETAHGRSPPLAPSPEGQDRSARGQPSPAEGAGG